MNKQVNPSPEYGAAVERNEGDAPAVVKEAVQGVVGGKEHAEHTTVCRAPPYPSKRWPRILYTSVYIVKMEG